MRTFVDTQQGIFSPSLLHGHSTFFLSLSFKNIQHSFLIPHSQTPYIIFFPHSWILNVLSFLPLSFMDIQRFPISLTGIQHSFSIPHSWTPNMIFFPNSWTFSILFSLSLSFMDIQHFLFLSRTRNILSSFHIHGHPTLSSFLTHGHSILSLLFISHSWTSSITSSLIHGHPTFSLNPSFIYTITLSSFYKPRHLTFHLLPSLKDIQHSLFLLPNSWKSNTLLYSFIIHGNLQATFRLFFLFR